MRCGWLVAAVWLVGCDDGGSGSSDGGPPGADGGGGDGGGGGAGGGVPALFLTPEVRYPACGQPSAIGAADLDGDGHLDLVVACAQQAVDEGVVVLRGAGDGTFGAARRFEAGGLPTALTTGDFDGDGHPDVAVGLRAGGAAVLLGDGAGALAAPLVFDAGADVTALVAAQLDGRGGDDLAVASRGDPQIAVLVGGAQQPLRVPVPRAPLSLAALDVDRDGDLDLVAGGGLDRAGYVAVLAGAGDGTFAAPAEGPMIPGPEVQALATGDFDGDGAPELAIGADAAAIGRGATLAFERFVAVDRGRGGVPIALATGDYDGDGHLDLAALVTFGAGPGAVTVLRGDGAGRVRAPDLFFGMFDTASALAGGDFDGDGRPDVAVANAHTGEVSVLLDRTQPTGGEDGDDAVCLRACARMRTCTGLDLPLCHDGCLLSPAFLECGRQSPDECDAVAACAFVQQCGEPPSGALACAEAAACEGQCVLEGRDCTCACAEQTAFDQSAELLANNFCASERCPACADRADPQACFACIEERCADVACAVN